MKSLVCLGLIIAVFVQTGCSTMSTPELESKYHVLNDPTTVVVNKNGYRTTFELTGVTFEDQHLIGYNVSSEQASKVKLHYQMIETINGKQFKYANPRNALWFLGTVGCIGLGVFLYIWTQSMSTYGLAV